MAVFLSIIKDKTFNSMAAIKMPATQDILRLSIYLHIQWALYLILCPLFVSKSNFVTLTISEKSGKERMNLSNSQGVH